MGSGGCKLSVQSALVTVGSPRPESPGAPSYGRRSKGPVAPLRATGRSMYPTIHPGDWLFVSAVSNLRSGDIAVFDRGGELVVHRVLSVRRGLEQGDASPRRGRFLPEQVLGVVTAIDRNGRTMDLDRLSARVRGWCHVGRGYGELARDRMLRCLGTTRRAHERGGLNP